MSAEILTYSKPMDDLPIEYSPSSENVINEKLDPDTIVLNWALNAEALQQDLYIRLGNRIFDEYEVDEAEYLEVKIAYAKFGPPNINDESQKSITYDEFQKIHHYADEKSNIIQAYSTLYSPEQRKKAKETLSLILKLIKKQDPTAKNFKVAFIFVVYQLGETDLCGLIPIIRVLRKEGDPEDEAWYIDQENRVYNNWANYLEENRLPKLRISYPKNGYYSVNENGYSIYLQDGRVVVKFGMTPASKLSHKLLRGLDWTSSGVLIGSLGIAVAAALSAPISAPILTGAAVGSSVAALYGASRSGATLVDRKLHEQTINVKNSEARSCWIGIGGAVFALSASSATLLLEKAVELGQTVGTSALYTVNGLNTGALVFNAAGVANQAHYLGERLVKGQGITAFEVLEFTLSTFLFTNALVSFQTANAQILEGHKEITSAGQAADAAKKPPGFLDRFTKHFEAENLFDRNSRVIRTLNSIEKPKEFFTKSVELTKQLNKVAGKIDARQKSKLNINGAEIHTSMITSQTDKNQLQLPTSNNFPRTFSEPALNDQLEKNKSKEQLGYRSKIEEILLNDYKFLAMIGSENEGVEGVRRLENQIWKSFDNITNKDFTYELVKICINLSKQLGITSTEDFIYLCSALKKFFHCNTQPLLKKLSNDVEKEILVQLKEKESSLHKNLVEELTLEFFRKLNDKNTFRLEDATTAYHSYEAYAKTAKSLDQAPIKPKEFMEKINWLFKETQPHDHNLVSYKGRNQYRNLYISDGWRGVLYENEAEPKNRVVTEFEYKGESSLGAKKEGFLDKVGSLFQ